VAGRADGTGAFLRELGVRELPPLTAPFDPGYDAVTLEAHLEQSAHLMSSLKLSMASWIVADERATRRKLAAARAHGVPATTGGGPFEVAVAQGRLEPYLDLCAALGFSRIECGAGFTEMTLSPDDAVGAARQRGLEVPRDTSIVGYDDSPLIAFTDPPLTTIRQPVQAMSSAAVRALLEEIAGNPAPSTEYVFQPDLVVRGSTASGLR
jgi:hypothetical protein